MLTDMNFVLASVLGLRWWHVVLLFLGVQLLVVMIVSIIVRNFRAEVVFSQKDRKSIRRLVLPNSAVKVVSSNRSEEESSSTSSHTLCEEQRPHLVRKTASTPWAKVKAVAKRNMKTLRSMKTVDRLMKTVDRLRQKEVDWDSFETCFENPEQNRASRAGGYTPNLVFVNSRAGAGGKQGAQVLRQMRDLLHRLQVVALPKASPEAAILWWSKHVKKYHVVVCGGDGTAGWVLGVLDKMQGCLDYVPPVAILPLGTGNDLARVLGWGGGYTGGSILPMLQQVSKAHTLVLDRWTVTCRDGEGHKQRQQQHLAESVRKQSVLCNYFGIGVDAAVALDFHNLRESRLDLFFSRLLNKVWYAYIGLKATLLKPGRRLSSKICIECDGVPLQIPQNLEGIVVLNINSFGGGSDLWGFSEESKEEQEEDSEDSDEEDASDHLARAQPRMNDGKLEVVGVQGALQLGAAQVGLSSFVRLAQASHIKITNHKALPIQVDGEPCRFAENGEIEICQRGQAFVSARSVAQGDAMATEIVDFAWESKMISADQRSQLLNRIANDALQRDATSPPPVVAPGRVFRKMSAYPLFEKILACLPSSVDVADWFIEKTLHAKFA